MRKTEVKPKEPVALPAPTIRPMLTSDIGSVLYIEKLSLPTQWSRSSYLRLLDGRQSFCKVATINDKTVGYITSFFILDEGQIYNLAVHPKYRRQGIATALFRELLDERSQYFKGSVYLEVRQSNTIARNLYKSLGFQKIGMRKEYYTNPTENCIVMKLTLT
ncbi:ribosomal-protein-alanine acetyltransferase [Candidatus Magnetoovum chiemensis]|nr:ribosomal-protein-alanine acetyltransferase [Candidatus Magnetoovum chiemensis]